MKPLFTVVTVSYNSQDTIEQTILSVLNQTFIDYEYLIIDGGSDDNTIEIIKRYEKKFDGKLRWLSEPDDGIYDAMNKGVRLANGQYVGMLNSDDWYQKTTLQVVSENVTNSPDIIYGMLNVLDDEKLLYVYANYVDKLPQESLAHPSTFVSKRYYKSIGLYATKYRSTSDYEFFLRAYNEGASFKFVESILANFRCGGMSAGSLGYFETLHIRKEYGYISNSAYISALMIRKIKDFVLKIKSTIS